MFKVAAQRANFSSPAGFILLLTDPVFLFAVPLYAMLMVAWVWILTFTPLSKAYLFVALAQGWSLAADFSPLGWGSTSRFLSATTNWFAVLQHQAAADAA